MKYLVRTKSCFSNIYIVEAENEEAAKAKVLDDDADFYQQHLGEEVVHCDVTVDSEDAIIKGLRDKGYF